MSNILCPACGSHNISARVEKQAEQLTLGPEFQFEETVFTCGDCGTEGDFANENDAKYIVAHKSALNISVKNIIESLSTDDSVSMAYFERAFELPARTLTRWKTGDVSSSAIALLRTVKTFPWLLEVADSHFNKNKASQIILREGIRVFQKTLEQNPFINLSGYVTESPTAISATANFVIGKNLTKPRLKTVGENS